jgi:prolipoprotein diacylglyceryl transferase
VPKFTWDIDPALFKIPVPLIGTLEIRYYSLIFVLVFLGGYALLNWQIRRGGGDEEEAGDFIIYGVLGVLLGARLGHVLFYDLDKALRDPSWVFKIWTGGLASHGAVIGLIVAMYLFTKRRGVPFLEGADRFAFSAALGASLVRVGNFFNSEIVGKPTDQTWGVQFPRFDGEGGPFRHPSQLYEATMGFAILGILFLLDKRLGKEERPLLRRTLLRRVRQGVPREHRRGRFDFDHGPVAQYPRLSPRGVRSVLEFPPPIARRLGRSGSP